MTFNIPDWLNGNFFEKTLRSSRGDKNLKILDFQLAPLEDSREHYASTIIKATVKYSNKFNCEDVIKLLIKLVVPKANAFSDENSFDTELNMYLSTLPDMQRLLSQNSEKIEIAPKLLFSSKDPVPVLVFEDVTAYGYETVESPLDLEETKFVATKLAKFHAASVYLDRDGQGVSYYKSGLFNLKSRDGINFMRNNMHLFIDELKTWHGYEECAEKMQNVAEKFEELGEKVYQANSACDGFNVLNHGDFNFKNMLFKKDGTGKFCDVLFIDYQMSKWGSPAIDIFYLLYLVASRDVLTNSREEIINHYYQELIKSLHDIGFMYKPPNILDLNIELMKNGFLEVLIAVCFMPFMFMDGNFQQYAEVAYENGIEGIELRKKLYRLPEYKEFITELFHKFVHNGLIF